MSGLRMPSDMVQIRLEVAADQMKVAIMERAEALQEMIAKGVDAALADMQKEIDHIAQQEVERAVKNAIQGALAWGEPAQAFKEAIGKAVLAALTKSSLEQP